MKKTLLCWLIPALLIPAVAKAQTEFSLGGYVKLETFWDSTQSNTANSTLILRNNNPNFHHGRLRLTTQNSRIHLTIKGPEFFGAKTSGFIEIDFNSAQDPSLNAANNYIPRLRHAMFEFKWPETELLLGQYWSMFCEYSPELTEANPLQFRGVPSVRLAQVRLTQKLAGCLTVAGFIGEPNRALTGNFLGSPAVPNGHTLGGHNGESAESPQVQAKAQFQKDLWGKAAFFGAPRPFTAQIVCGWQRNEARNNNQTAFVATTFGQNDYEAQVAVQKDHQYLNSWMLQGTLFIPVLPTHSYNLKGTASLTAQYYIGAGLEAFGETTVAGNSFFQFRGIGPGGVPFFDLELTKRYGGYIQGQYYFTNTWFMNLAWGFNKPFGITRGRDGRLAAFNGGNSPGYVYASNVDQPQMNQEIAGVLWYRPVIAFKFGLEYAYSRTDWFQKLSTGAVGLNVQDVGDGHRIQFVAFFYL
ncbi:MAG: hypothetical protein ACYC6G_01810 [Desulfobaccales bacterium]